jgi:prevent-host-death family protein
MLNAITWDSQAVQERWSALLAAVTTGEGGVVITEHGQPVAAVIDYEDWLELEEALDDLYTARRADATFAAYQNDPSGARPWDDFRAELVAEGLLDDAA